MGRDRSLDEFVSVSNGADETAGSGRDDAESSQPTVVDPDASAAVEDVTAATDGREAGEVAGSGDETDRDDERLPRATYRWSPDGDDCPVCGTHANAQWCDGDRFVCADCKEW